MGPANCAVIDCTNSTYNLKKWQQTECIKPEHENKLQIECGCTQPFRLFMFPSELRNGERRKQWITLMKRETLKKAPWTPKPSDRVCSEHFVDKIPTPENPFPSLKLGYTTEEKPKRRELFRQKIDIKKLPTAACASTLNQNTPISSPHQSPTTFVHQADKQNIFEEHSYCFREKNSCDQCNEKAVFIEKYKKKVQDLTKKLSKLRVTYSKGIKSSKPFSIEEIKTDEKMNFYTGITSISNFETIYKALSSGIPSITLWRGPCIPNYSTKEVCG